MTYNTENLFDCSHDSLKNDYEFLPDALRHWTPVRFEKKANAIARAIIAVGGWSVPALVALCEVENERVMEQLVRYSLLSEADYRYVITHSPDERGINVALLYQRRLFKLLSSQSVSIRKPHADARPTRDILHVCGQLLSGDTLDVFVVHAPSRSGGTKKSEPYRRQVARQLREQADSVMQVRACPLLIIMGDFNDPPHSRSVHDELGAIAPEKELHPRRLYHLLSRRCSESRDFGSYKYQGKWELIDHIIVSGCLLDGHARLQTDESRCDVCRLPFLLTDDTRYGGLKPFRSYNGMRYQEGYSDHLPVWAEFTLFY